MKIVQVINIPWWNAAAEYCITLANALSDREHDVIVIAEKDTPAYKKALASKLQVETMISFKPLYFLSDLFTIKRIFRTIYQDVQIVNVHTAPAQSIFIIAKFLFNLRYKLIRTRIDLRKIKHYPLNKFSYKSLDGIIVTSKQDKDELLSFTNIKESKIKVIYAGIDIKRFKPNIDKQQVRTKFNIQPDVLVVGNIARRSPVKGHDVFFKSAQLIFNEVQNVLFVTAGVDDTVSLEQLKDMAKKAGVIEKTLILDYIENVEDLINCFDVGVVSSIGSEKHSRITLEYMACGVPVVGSNVGNVPELIIDRKTGYIVKSGNFIDMADAVIKLLKDKELREVFSYNARKHVEQKFSYSSFAQLTEVFYLETLGRKEH